MKKKFAVVMSFIMMVAISAAIITYSFAWFSASQSFVNASDGRFIASDTASALITSSNASMVPNSYGGETGLDTVIGQDDYPFKAITTFSVTFKPKSEGNVVKGNISCVNIKLKDYEIDPETNEVKGLLTSENDPKILKSFSFDVYLVQINENGDYLENYYPAHFFGKTDGLWYDSMQNVVENTSFVHYFPSECFGKDDNILRDADGNPIPVGEPEIEHEFVFVIEITFLDRESYCLFRNKTGEPHPEHEITATEMKPFAYSDYLYMQSIYEIYFDVGFTSNIAE